MSLFLIVEHTNRIASRTDVNRKLLDNVKSTWNLLTHNGNLASYDQIQTIDLFKKGTDTVVISKKHWGVLDVVTVQAQSRGKTRTETALTGSTHKGYEKVALVMTDNIRALALCGKTVLEGDVFLPKPGVKRAYIEGKSFVGNELIKGGRKIAAQQLPEIDTSKEQYLKELLSGLTYKQNTEVEYRLTNSFQDETKVMMVEQGKFPQYAKGNIVLLSRTPVELTSQNELSNVLLIAPQIKIKSGFTGQIQCFASQKIEVESGVELNYPSALVIVGEEQVQFAFRKESSLSGTIFIKKKSSNTRGNRAKVEIDAGSEINGEVIVDGYPVNFSGVIKGTLYANQFRLVTPSSVYENHLLDVTISRTQRSLLYLDMSQLWKAKSTLNICAWVN